MGYENELLMLRKILDKCHLQNLIVNPNDVVDERVDKGLRSFFTSDFNVKATFSDFFPNIEHNTIYKVSDVFLCRYIFFRLPNLEEKQIFIAGPYVVTDILPQQVLQQCERIGISPKMSGELSAFYSSLPIIRDENYIFSIINAFTESIWGGENSYLTVEIDKESTAAFIIGGFELKNSSDVSKSVDVLEERYKFENELISAVSMGNSAKIEQMLSHVSALAFESRVPDQLRNAKNYCIIMNTLFRKAAEQGGVHPIYIDKVSTDFARRIEGITSMLKISEFMVEVIRTYCRLVRRHAVKKYSPVVQKAIIKIDHDLTADLSLSALATLNNVSPAYFSDLFKKETGQTLTKYVNGKRIAHAKYLLKNTSLQVQTIAQDSGILDLHYFCRIFKNETGKTPTEYRESIFFN